ncbi:MAG: ribosome-associated translation inhibitor RaiA [Bacteroidota bacterium]
MTLRVSGKNLDIGEALRTHVQTRVSDALSKYFEGGWTGHVTVEKEGSGFRTETSLHLATGLNLQSEARAQDAYASVDQAMERVVKRLRRYKRRVKDYHGKPVEGAAALPRDEAASYVIEAPSEDSDEAADGFAPTIIAESTTRLRRLSVSEAVMDLDLSGVPVLVFRHAGHGRVNLVYRRQDGHVGWIDPPAATTGPV